MKKPTAQLYHGNCLDFLPKIPSDSIDYILTDPPYGMTEMKWDLIIPFNRMWMELRRVIKKPGYMISLFGQEPFSSKLRLSCLEWWRLDYYWDKVNPANFVNAKYSPLQQIEVISCFSDLRCSTPRKDGKTARYFPRGVKSKFKFKDKTASLGKGRMGMKSLSNKFVSTNEGYPKNLIKCPKPGARSCHPTQKPIALLKYLIETYTLEGETVLDFTHGSGSTGVAAMKTNRNYVGIEISDKYFELSKERILAAQAESSG